MSLHHVEAENQKLKAELAGLHDILSSLGALVFTKDTQGRYTYANALTCEWLGRSLSEVVGHTDSDLFDPDTAKLLQSGDLVVLTRGGKNVHQEQLCLPHTRQTRHYLTTKAPLLDKDRQVLGVCGVAMDVTEQAEAQVQRAEAHQLLETVLDNMGTQVYMKDQEGRYLYVNRPFLESADLTPEQVLGRRDSDLFSAEAASAFEAVDAQVFATGPTLKLEEQLVDGRGQLQHYWTTKLLLQREGKPDCLIGLSNPVSDLKAAETARRRSEARFRALFESTSEAVLAMSRTQFLDCNDAALQLLGLASKEEFLQRAPADLWPALQPDGTPSLLRMNQIVGQALDQGRHRFEFTLRRHDNGLEIPVEAIVNVVELDDGPALLLALRDQSERKRYEEKITRLAFYDPLTQLPNRRLLSARLSQAMAPRRRGGHHGCVAFLDLDNFKPLNDQHGHGAGDILLQELARRLEGCLRSQDTVARLGGDEFVVLLTELDKEADAALAQGVRVAEKIRGELAQPYVITLNPGTTETKTVEHRCTASLGLALFGPEESDVNDVLRRADDAMYQAKADGRNQICIAGAAPA